MRKSVALSSGHILSSVAALVSYLVQDIFSLCVCVCVCVCVCAHVCVRARVCAHTIDLLLGSTPQKKLFVMYTIIATWSMN